MQVNMYWIKTSTINAGILCHSSSLQDVRTVLPQDLLISHIPFMPLSHTIHAVAFLTSAPQIQHSHMQVAAVAGTLKTCHSYLFMRCSRLRMALQHRLIGNTCSCSGQCPTCFNRNRKHKSKLTGDHAQQSHAHCPNTIANGLMSIRQQLLLL